MVPTVRSAIMIGVYELAVLLDREEEVFTSLTLAALLIALVWPGVIADISFQLSFLAVLFIVWGMRKLYRRLAREKSEELPQEKSWIKEKAAPGDLSFGGAAAGDARHRAVDRALLRPSVARGLSSPIR